MSITNWILRNESENQTHDLLFREEQIVEVQNFIIAWGFAERKIISGYSSLLRSANQEYLILNSYAFRVLLRSNHVHFIWNELLNRSYAYYHSRYIENGRVNTLYRLLHLDNISAILQNVNPTPEAKIRAVAYITTQIRHNIAHGRKNLDDIFNQQDLLRHATYGICGIMVALRLAQEYDLLPPPPNNER